MKAVLEQIDIEHAQKLQEVTAYYSNLKTQMETTLNALDYFNLPETKEIPLDIHCLSNDLITTEEFDNIKSDLEDKILDNILYDMSKWQNSGSGKKEVKIDNYQQKKRALFIEAKLIIHKPPINYTNIPQFTKKVRNYQIINSINPVYIQPSDEKLNIVHIHVRK